MVRLFGIFGSLIAVLLAAHSASAQPAGSMLETLPATESNQVFDVDRYLSGGEPVYAEDPNSQSAWSDAGEPWTWQLLPSGLVYKAYLAGQKESRFAGMVNYVDDHALWENTLGTRVGILRYGEATPFLPNGFQLDIEGSAQVRLDLMENVDVQAVDFRAGIPLTYGVGPHRYKAAYYHLSSHAGDEFLIANPMFDRLNFARDVFVLGYSYYWSPKLRLYAEMGWAFYTDVSKEWEFQFGLDYAPTSPTGWRGEPFFAINGHLREELNFGGNLTMQVGWAWMGDQSSHLFRTGLHYYNGASNQFSFYQEFEQQIGVAVWYDF